MTQHSPSAASLLATLGLSSTASYNEAHAAWKKTARALHKPTMTEHDTKRLQAINAAWTALRPLLLGQETAGEQTPVFERLTAYNIVLMQKTAKERIVETLAVFKDALQKLDPVALTYGVAPKALPDAPVLWFHFPYKWDIDRAGGLIVFYHTGPRPGLNLFLHPPMDPLTQRRVPHAAFHALPHFSHTSGAPNQVQSFKARSTLFNNKPITLAFDNTQEPTRYCAQKPLDFSYFFERSYDSLRDAHTLAQEVDTLIKGRRPAWQQTLLTPFVAWMRYWRSLDKPTAQNSAARNT